MAAAEVCPPDRGADEASFGSRGVNRASSVSLLVSLRRVLGGVGCLWGVGWLLAGSGWAHAASTAGAADSGAASAMVASACSCCCAGAASAAASCFNSPGCSAAATNGD